jgi:phosphohistidine phosphatase
MDLYVVRHAIAEERDPQRWPDDSQRPLTEKGRKRFGLIAQVVGRIVPEVDLVLSSRFVRAWQTAELLVEHANWPAPKSCEELELAPTGELCAALQTHAHLNSVAIVGHDPCLSEFVSAMLTGSEDRMDLDFKKGGTVCLQFPAEPQPGRATLLWYLTPRLARSLG